MKKNYKRIAGCFFTAMLLIAGGFMGVNQFMPEERSINIIEGSQPVSQTVAVSNDKMKVAAKAAILIDGNSGSVLFAQNEKKPLPPASVTKVMTILLVLESCDNGKINLDDKVTISEHAASMGGSQMYMEAGEQHTVEELLKGVIMVSANDGCVALAEYLCGSVESFVDKMNSKAKSMGLENSNFVNTNGLPVEGHYSCAYDIAMISKKLMEYEFAHKWFTAWQEDIKVGKEGKQNKFTLSNTNKLIKTYNGAIGVKTGFTEDAGYCLSGAAQRDDSRMIAVVLGCETSEIRFSETTRLLDYGFTNYTTIKVAEAGDEIKCIKTEKTDVDKFYAVPADDIKITVKKGLEQQIKTKSFIDKKAYSNVNKNEKIGNIKVYCGKKLISEHELVSDRNVRPASYMTIYIRLMKNLI